MTFKRTITLLGILVGLTPGALAEKTDPAMIPPDVTFSTATPPAPVAPAAPAAAAGGAAASTPGLSGSVAMPAGYTPIAPMNVNGYSVPKTSRGTATLSKPPGTKFGMENEAPQQGGAPDANTPQVSNGLYKGSGAAVSQDAADPIIVLTTSKGVIQMRLFPKYAPLTVESFLDLVNKGFYNGLIFHRVEPGFCIQGGCPNGTGTGLYIDPATHAPRLLPLEISPSLRHNTAGVVAMARMSSPNSASSQFYITLSAQPNLDGQYAVFGGVINGMDVVRSIEKGDKIISASVAAAASQ